MATIERDISVDAPGREIWSTLIADPNHWDEWLTPLKGLSEAVEGPVARGLSFGARIGNLSGKVKVVEVIEGQKLRWKAGPGPLLAMGMGMKGTLELDSHDGHTHVHLVMKSPPMMRPMMQAMTGLDTSDEMTKTINRIEDDQPHQGARRTEQLTEPPSPSTSAARAHRCGDPGRTRSSNPLPPLGVQLVTCPST